MIAKSLGARVIAVDRHAGALDAARALGADHVLVTGPGMDGVPERVHAITGGGSHVAVDAVGAEETCADSILSLRRRGRHLQVGLLPPAGGQHPRVPMARAIAWELDLLGSHGMAAADYPAMRAHRPAPGMARGWPSPAWPGRRRVFQELAATWLSAGATWAWPPLMRVAMR
jgi:alcohol dehydrogenase